MSGLIETASAIMINSEKRIGIVASNVSNVSVPGFKKRTFSQIFNSVNLNQFVSMPELIVRSDLGQGRLVETGNSLDLAIAGPGFFKLRMGEQVVISRQGQFHRASDGTLISQQGHVLQQVDGGDLVLDGTAVEVLADGTVLDGDRPVGRIALVQPESPDGLRPAGGAAFLVAEGELTDAGDAHVRQGVIETSNVDLAEEMMATMQALKQSETGARLATTYDELLGRAITSLGQGGS